MADFFQNGVIATLHRIKTRPVEELEAELLRYSRKRPMALVLPALYRELEGDALPKILDELSQVKYLSQIIIGLDKADEAQFRQAKKFFARLPQPHKVIWQDGPRMVILRKLLKEQGLYTGEPGKGRNAWMCYGYVIASGQARVVGLHDCDILTYKRNLLARLFFPTANPHFGIKFCKGYYARVRNRMYGRVDRLFLTPLLRSLKKILGQSDYLDYMDSYRYPLAGEFSMERDVIENIRIPSDWGLEVGMLTEVYRNYANRQICQVDIADNYDHKHQELSEQNPEAGLAKMSIDIAKSLYRTLATQGVVFSEEFFRTIKAVYLRTALNFLDKYYYDAKINGLLFDRHAEEKSIEVFFRSIIIAGEHFLANPMEIPSIPNWSRVVSAIPDFYEMLYRSVEEDNKMD